MSDVRWEGHSHAEIYALVHKGPGDMISLSAHSLWKDAQALIQNTDKRIADAIKQSSGGWEGAAADATRAAMSPLQDWALDATGDATLTASAVDAQARQAMNVRNTMPEPPDPKWALYGSDTMLIVDTAADEAREANNHARAVELMNGYMGTSFQNQSQMDYWTRPPSITIETASAAPPSPGGGVTPATSGAAPIPPAGADWSPPAASTPPSAPAPPGAIPNGAAPGTAAPGTSVPVMPGATVPGGPSGTSQPPAPGRGPGNVGTGPGTVPAATSGRPVPPDATGARPGGVVPRPTGPVPGGADGSRTPTGRTPPGPGGVRPVVPAPPRNPATPSWRDVVPGGGREPAASGERPAPRPEAARPAAARPGGPMQPGLYPPMIAGTAGSEGREHRRPDYLVEDADIFADDRWFTPPVIGGEEAR